MVQSDIEILDAYFDAYEWFAVWCVWFLIVILDSIGQKLSSTGLNVVPLINSPESRGSHNATMQLN